MFSSFRHALLCCGSALALMSASDPVIAQSAGAVTLPEITITAPSPITTAVPAARTWPEEPQRGILPIVTDQFATVTVVPNEELRRTGAATLGDQLFSRPGMTGSSFAPGAASRPIIRGLDVNRVGIVENSIDNGGVSDLGEDHGVPIDPLAVNQIEVIRGPAALRWGSTSIGGVVSATNNRIPEAPPCGPTPLQTYGYEVVAGAPTSGCVNVETRSAVSSVDRGIEGGVLIDAAGPDIAFHADAYGRRSSDYAIPGHPYVFDQEHPVGGRQPNSSARAFGGSIGGSYLFHGGFVGASVTHNAALYHIPGLHSSELNERIDARQTRVNAKGAYRPDWTIIDTVRFWAGATDYRHDELGLEDSTDPASDAVHQTFTNKAQEGRVELQFMPFDARFADVTTAVGFHAGHQKLTASSPENSGALFNGLFDPNSNRRVAGYVFNELQFSPGTKAQLAGRVEHVKLDGTMPDFPADVLPGGTPQVDIARSPSFTPVSGSVGLLQNLPGDLVASVTGQYVERAPKPAELFSRGSHHATATFDIGNPDLKVETAQSIEIGLRRSRGPFRFEATAFYTRFNDFIYRRMTGAFCHDDFDSCHIHDHHHDDHEEEAGHEEHGHSEELRQAVYTQRDAVFRGGEFQSQLDVAPVFNGVWGIESQFDIVRATFTDGTNVPRIPPARIGGGLFYRDQHWFARINLLHAFAQRDIAAEETETAGYNLLRAEVSYRTPLDPARFGARELTVGAYGNNLLNEKIRSAVSFTKDEVLLPGINVRLFANLKF